MAETEQNKTEEATPFKLKKAREKGTVARGVDLGFFSTLAAFMVFFLLAGANLARDATAMMQRLLRTAMTGAAEPVQAPHLIAAAFLPAVQSLALLAATIAVVVVVFEIVQIRGIVFTLQPLKPDFSRLDPAKGLKRLFSMRLLKETAKNVVKMTAYGTATYFVARYIAELYGRTIVDGVSLADALRGGTLRLLAVFTLIALAFVVIDQIISRREFMKQMRMSRSELTRELRDREGEPRIKQKRKQLHAEFAKQTKSLGDLSGSDMLIVNPEHYAVALRYDAARMSAPQVAAKGKNHFALHLRRQAALLSIPIFEHPQLARSLYRGLEKGDEVKAQDYRAVADLYLKLSAASGPRQNA